MKVERGKVVFYKEQIKGWRLSVNLILELNLKATDLCIFVIQSRTEKEMPNSVGLEDHTCLEAVPHCFSPKGRTLRSLLMGREPKIMGRLQSQTSRKNIMAG